MMKNNLNNQKHIQLSIMNNGKQDTGATEDR